MEKKKTEFDISFGSSSRGGWGLRIMDARSHLPIIDAYLTDEQLGRLFGAEVRVPGELSVDERHGRCKSMSTFVLPLTPGIKLYGGEWGEEQDRAEGVLQSLFPAQTILRESYYPGKMCVDGSGYTFTTMSWVDAE